MPPRKRRISPDNNVKDISKRRKSTRNLGNYGDPETSIPSSQETVSSASSASSISQRTRSSQIPPSSSFSSPENTKNKRNHSKNKSNAESGTDSLSSSADVSPSKVLNRKGVKKTAEVLVSPNRNILPLTHDTKESNPLSNNNDINLTPLINEVTTKGSPKRSTRVSKRVKPISPSENDEHDISNDLIASSENASQPSKRARIQEVPSSPNVVEDDPEVWKKWPKSCDLNNPLLTRRWFKPERDAPLKNGHSANHASEICVFTNNILSETLLKKSHNFSYILPAHYEQNTRHKKLIAEINHINPDVLCFQEVEESYFKNSLSKELKSMGLESHFSCNSIGSHGLVIAFLKSKFHLLDFQFFNAATEVLERFDVASSALPLVKSYVNEPEVCQVAMLGLKSTDSPSRQSNYDSILCVANIHVTYAHHKKLDLRCLEVTQTFARMSQSCNKFSNSSGAAHKKPSWIFCGDFNSLPTSMVYQLAKDGYPNEQTIETLLKCKAFDSQSNLVESPTENGEHSEIALVDVFWQAFQHSFADVSSCYKVVMGDEPPMTMNMINNRGCLDYIWFGSEGLEPMEVLLPPCEYMRDRQDRLPDELMHTDHASLACKMRFR